MDGMWAATFESVRVKEVAMIPCRSITAMTRTIIVLEGLSGRPITEICEEYNISEELYAIWRKHFLKNASKVFE
jgi:hypothetical protein